MCDVLSFVITVWYALIHFQSKIRRFVVIGPCFKRELKEENYLHGKMSLAELLEKQKESTESDATEYQQADYQGESHDCYPHEGSCDETSE